MQAVASSSGGSGAHPPSRQQSLSQKQLLARVNSTGGDSVGRDNTRERVGSKDSNLNSNSNDKDEDKAGPGLTAFKLQMHQAA